MVLFTIDEWKKYGSVKKDSVAWEGEMLNRLYWELEAEKIKMEKILLLSSERLKNAPKGSLRISRGKCYVEYYHLLGEEGDVNHLGKYIRKENRDLVKQLAQKDYDLKVQKIAKNRLVRIESLLKELEENEIDEIYDNLNPQRQLLVTRV